MLLIEFGFCISLFHQNLIIFANILQCSNFLHTSSSYNKYIFHEKQDFYIYGMYVSLYCKNDWLCSIYSPLGCYIPKLFFCNLEKLSMHVLPNLANKVLRVLCACSHVSYIIVFQKHTYEKWAWHFTSHCQGNGISELVPVIVCIPEKGYSLKNM